MRLSKSTRALIAECEADSRAKAQGRLEPFVTIGHRFISIRNGYGVELPVRLPLPDDLASLRRFGAALDSFLAFASTTKKALQAAAKLERMGLQSALPPTRVADWRNLASGWTARGLGGRKIIVRAWGGGWRVLVGDEQIDFGEWPCDFMEHELALAVANEIALGFAPTGFHWEGRPYAPKFATGAQAQLVFVLDAYRDADEETAWRDRIEWKALRAAQERGDI